MKPAPVCPYAVLTAALILSACSGGSGSSSAPAAPLVPSYTQSSVASPQSESVMYAHALVEDGASVPDTHVFLPHRIVGAVPPAVSPAAAENVSYHGGLVMTFPAIGIVYWGFGPNGDPDNEIPRLNHFLQHLRGAAPMNVLEQYYQIKNGHKEYIPNYPAMSVAVWKDDTNPLPAAPKDKDVRAEALRAAAYFDFDLPGVDDLIIVAIPHGVPMNWAACAYHGKVDGITYTNLPYQPDFGAGCGAFSVNSGSLGRLDGVTETAVHEVAESMSDPFFAGWFDAQGNEIADKCQQYAANADFDGKTFAVQPLWSNAKGGCAY
jgi:hypothetical protein